MGKITEPQKVKLITGLIVNDLGILDKVRDILLKHFGPIDYKSDIFNFDKTDYYEKEMGKNLKRRFYSFNKLILPDELAGIKLYTNKLEEEFMLDNGNRRINIDPGYITASKLVLATIKNYQHRIYLTGGIYAEITLKYKKESFIPGEWAYPDYSTEEYIKTFNNIRRLYMEHLRQ